MNKLDKFLSEFISTMILSMSSIVLIFLITIKLEICVDSALDRFAICLFTCFSINYIPRYFIDLFIAKVIKKNNLNNVKKSIDNQKDI